MTRYCCADSTHRRGTDPRTIDVTAQVRLERELQPRAAAYLASTERILASVPLVEEEDEARRVDAVRELLTGSPHPREAAVILASERSVGRGPGLYEVEELSGSEPGIDRLVATASQRQPSATMGEDVYVLEEPPPTGSDAGTVALGDQVAGDVLVTQASGTRILPQGVFELDELANRLAHASTGEASLVESIRSAPQHAGSIVQENWPWRVVINCPGLEGDPPLRHQIAFTGTGGVEPAVVYGTPAAGWDAIIESAVETDLAPPLAMSRMERRVKVLVLAELAIAALLFALAWGSGALAMAARETPAWLGFAAVLLLGSLVFAATPLYAPSGADGNANDTLVIGRFYRSRLELLGWAAAISATLFALSVLAAVVPPMVAASPLLPGATVSFDSGAQPVTALVTVAAGDIATDRSLVMDVRQFGRGDQVGTVVGHVVTTGNADGRIEIAESIALDAGAQYLSVGFHYGDAALAICGPMSSQPGCTVVAVPPLGAGIAPAAGVPIVSVSVARAAGGTRPV